MKFGLCYIPDYHQELSGSWQDWYEGMIEEVKLAEQLGFQGAWFAEHRVPGFAFGSPAMFIAACADPALGRYQAFTKATDLSRQAYRDPVAYKDWKGFFANRETITLEQMKASRAVIGQPEECIEKVAMLCERFGVTYLCFEVNFGALPHVRVMESMERFAATVMRHFR